MKFKKKNIFKWRTGWRKTFSVIFSFSFRTCSLLTVYVFSYYIRSFLYICFFHFILFILLLSLCLSVFKLSFLTVFVSFAFTCLCERLMLFSLNYFSLLSFFIFFLFFLTFFSFCKTLSHQIQIWGKAFNGKLWQKESLFGNKTVVSK